MTSFEEAWNMKRPKLPFVGVLLAMALVIGCSPTTPNEPSVRQRDASLLRRAEALTPQSGQGSALKTAFNNASDKVRLMVLLSPT
jgi:hypothetical protein